MTGPIHFKSNVNLYLEENAILNFTDNPSDYLPAVMTSWEGLECYNYSPLLYAFEKKELRNILEEAVDTEEMVKTGRLNDVMSVELFIVKYSAA